MGVVGTACSDTLRVTGCAGLDQTPPGAPFGVFLVARRPARGLTLGTENLRALGGGGESCLLMSDPVHDYDLGAVDRTAPKAQRQGAPEPQWLGACLLTSGPLLMSWVGLGGRGPAPSRWQPEAQVSVPSPERLRQCTRPRADCLTSWCAREYPMHMAPEPPVILKESVRGLSIRTFDSEA